AIASSDRVNQPLVTTNKHLPCLSVARAATLDQSSVLVGIQGEACASRSFHDSHLTERNGLVGIARNHASADRGRGLTRSGTRREHRIVYPIPPRPHLSCRCRRVSPASRRRLRGSREAGVRSVSTTAGATVALR